MTEKPKPETSMSVRFDKEELASLDVAALLAPRTVIRAKQIKRIIE